MLYTESNIFVYLVMYTAMLKISALILFSDPIIKELMYRFYT